jgi:hypothetical protein
MDGPIPSWAWVVIILVVMAVIYISWTIIEMSFPDVRIARLLKGMDIYKSLMAVAPVLCDASDNAYKVCDYYIASSARTVFPSGSIFDYVDPGTITKVLAAGARWIELDIFDEGGRPVVTAANTKFGFRQTYNKVYLEDALSAIAANAWNPKSVPNSTDPLFLSLNLLTENTTTMNNTAAIVLQALKSYMLDATYAHQAINIAQEPICNLKGKVVIVSGGNIKNTDLDELVNLSWSGPYLRRYTVTQAEETYDHQELTDFNRQAMTVVVPDPSSKNDNKDATLAWNYGCQAVEMHYSKPDAAMETYIGQFQLASFVLKPLALRYNPPTYAAPTPQDPVKSYAPIQVTTPMYTATI